ncbi:MAG: aldehyde ferredoxin oxidoreductase C-terminal domain-containing protein, partial [Chloroflexota bacterium]
VREIMEVGERVMNLQKVYAMRRGLTKADDMDISPRILEPQKVGPTAGLSLAPYLKEGVEEFYVAMGWDRETGRPLPETLRRLGLQDIVKDLPPGGPRGRNRRPTES